MRLRAQIIIDVEADDFATAAEHQKRLEDLYREVRHHYEQARFDFRQRRLRTGRNDRPSQPQHYTGRMSSYRE